MKRVMSSSFKRKKSMTLDDDDETNASASTSNAFVSSLSSNKEKKMTDGGNTKTNTNGGGFYSSIFCYIEYKFFLERMRNLFSFELLELALNICHRNGLVGVIIKVIPFAILELDLKSLSFLS